MKWQSMNGRYSGEELASMQKDAMELSLAAPEFYVVGDCVVPNNIMEATGSARAVAGLI